jgi:pyruvate formate lyase activating enzyme
MGAVDGPGLRSVIFLQGCPLRCAYCHNPETWSASGGTEISLEDLVAKIERYRSYIQKDGGVTVSGGEALLQWDFVSRLFQALQEKGYHTALDTSGAGDLDGARKVLANTDLVIADLKFTDPQLYKRYCHGDLQQVYDFLALTAQMQIPLWIRQVIVPGLNDTPESVLALKAIASTYPNLKKIELLPFRKLCEGKYRELGLPFPLADTPDCPPDTVKSLEQLL